MNPEAQTKKGSKSSGHTLATSIPKPSVELWVESKRWQSWLHCLHSKTKKGSKEPSLKHIWNLVDARQCPLMGGRLKGGLEGWQKERRTSKRGNHDVAKLAFGETMQPRNIHGEWSSNMGASSNNLLARTCVNIGGGGQADHQRRTWIMHRDD